MPSAGQAEVWAGAWQGSLNVGSISFRIALVLKQAASGAVTAGTFNNIDDGIYDQPLERLSFQKGELSADLAGGEAIQLRLKNGGLQGRYRQSNGSFQTPGVFSHLRLVRGNSYLIPRPAKAGQSRTLYRYRKPRALEEGWETEDWAKAGLDLKTLRIGMRKVLDESYPHIHSVQAAYRDKLVLDEYFYGYGPEDLHPLQSETKSVFSALMGIARDQGRIQTDDKIYDFFPGFRQGPYWTSPKDQITVRDLLTMTSGFACDDWKDARACSWAMTRSSDWLAFALDESLQYPPGSHFAYCGACLVPLSVALQARSGLAVPNFARKFLFDPLGIGRVQWFTGPGGVVPVSFGLQMRPRDLLKVGELYLEQGQWKGRKILSEDWIRQSTRVQIHLAPSRSKNDYGYLWWERPMAFHDTTVEVFFAWGVGGQYLFVVPALNLTCVITAGNYKDSRLGADSLKLFQENILGALPMSLVTHPGSDKAPDFEVKGK
ncbi:MAG: serine hydrolase domain-containing protein [bacterium]